METSEFNSKRLDSDTLFRLYSKAKERGTLDDFFLSRMIWYRDAYIDDLPKERVSHSDPNYYRYNSNSLHKAIPRAKARGFYASR